MIEERPMPLKPKPILMGGLEVNTSVTCSLESVVSTSLLPTSGDLQRMRQDWNGILSRSNSRSMSGGTKNYISEVYTKFKRLDGGASGDISSIVENAFSKGGLLGNNAGGNSGLLGGNNGGGLGRGLSGVTKSKTNELLFQREIVSVEKQYESLKAITHTVNINKLIKPKTSFSFSNTNILFQTKPTDTAKIYNPIGSFSDFKQGSLGNIYKDIKLKKGVNLQERYDFKKDDDTHINFTLQCGRKEYKNIDGHKIELSGFPSIFGGVKKKKKAPNKFQNHTFNF